MFMGDARLTLAVLAPRREALAALIKTRRPSTRLAPAAFCSSVCLGLLIEKRVPIGPARSKAVKRAGQGPEFPRPTSV